VNIGSEALILYLGALTNFLNICYKQSAHNAVECARLPALFFGYPLACYALCRHFPTPLKFPLCLPFTLGGTLFSAAVLFGCSSNFFLQLGVLKRVSPSVTVGRVLGGVARTSVSFVIGCLSSGIAMQPFY